MNQMKVEKDWTTKAGLRAVVVISLAYGHRCGYVGIDASHPLFNTWYRQKTPVLDNKTPASYFKVHGKITYADKDANYPVESDLYWYGYDCMHGNSVVPQFLLDMVDYDGDEDDFGMENENKSLEYCVEECEKLADQLVEVEKNYLRKSVESLIKYSFDGSTSTG